MNTTKIGKDVIESLTLGMYEDARIIYREYIQNAADQIDKAVALGVLPSKEDGEIFVEVDDKNRRITIEDNATGIEKEHAIEILKNIAHSNKQRGIDKGFRGIGRLGGLAYCNILTFETSCKGEATKTMMIWDAKELKRIINNRYQKEEASEVIDEITAFSYETEEIEKHYFRVILEEVSHDALLDVENIRYYLSMVAPVPLHPHFTFSSQFRKYLVEKDFSIDEYTISINSEFLYKAYTTKIYDLIGNNKTTIAEIEELKFFDYYDADGKLLCYGWYGLWTFTREIPKKLKLNPARGFRLRKGNIQIGDETCLVKLHKESRGNFYFFGEIHAVHPDLIPNARRDYFLENEYCRLFEDKLRKLFNELYGLYHFSSNIRSEYKKIEKYHQLEKEFSEKESKGFANKEEAEEKKKLLGEAKVGAEKAESKIERLSNKVEENDSKKKLVESLAKKIDEKNASYKIQEEITRIPPDSKPIKAKLLVTKPKLLFLNDGSVPRLTKEERKLVLKVFNVISKCLSDKEIVENIRLKIIEEFNK